MSLNVPTIISDFNNEHCQSLLDFLENISMLDALLNISRKNHLDKEIYK
jgi:hypothetical protein